MNSLLHPAYYDMYKRLCNICFIYTKTDKKYHEYIGRLILKEERRKQKIIKIEGK